MTQPWLFFVFGTLGLIQGGSIDVLQAPVRWFVAGMDAPEIMRAQTCALAVLP